MSPSLEAAQVALPSPGLKSSHHERGSLLPSRHSHVTWKTKPTHRTGAVKAGLRSSWVLQAQVSFLCNQPSSHPRFTGEGSSSREAGSSSGPKITAWFKIRGAK